MNTLRRVILLFLSIITIELLFLSLATSQMPNQINIEIFNNLALYSHLLQSNPLTILNLLLFEKPVVIIQRMDSLGTTQVWGFYIMPITFISLLTLSIMLSRLIELKMILENKHIIIPATVILCISVFYLRLQSCCTADPNWLFDVLLLVRVYDPELDTIFWQEFYMMMTNWFKPMQIFMASTALLLFYKIFFSIKSDSLNAK